MKALKYKRVLVAAEKVNYEASKEPEQNAKVVPITQPQEPRKIIGPPTNRQIYANIGSMPVPELVKHWDAIREKRSTLPMIQRAIVIRKIKEYIQLGIVKVDKPDQQTV